jgi:RNA polymerase sigma-70 factor (ECF subfamily)
MPTHLPHETDAETIGRCLAGDRSAYRLLYEAHRDLLFNIARRMHRNPQDAEDSVQEAFIRIVRFLPRFRGECRFSTWACRILMNTCLSQLRKTRPPVAGFKGNGVQIADRAADGGVAPVKMILEQEIARLPLGFRTVFILHEVEGFSHEEIAHMLDVTEGTSKSQLFKAKRVLRKWLRPFLDILETNP